MDFLCHRAWSFLAGADRAVLARRSVQAYFEPQRTLKIRGGNWPVKSCFTELRAHQAMCFGALVPRSESRRQSKPLGAAQSRRVPKSFFNNPRIPLGGLLEANHVICVSALARLAGSSSSELLAMQIYQ